MSHQDQGRSTANESHLQALNRVARRWLGGLQTPTVKFRDDCTWSVRSLCSGALFWAVGDQRNLTDRFSTARKIIVRMFPRQGEPASSYQAFIKLLRKWTVPLLAALMLCFRRRMEEGEAGEFSTCGFAIFAVDGSRVELPRSLANQKAYCSKKVRERAKHGGKPQRKRSARKKKKGRKKPNKKSPRGSSGMKKLDNPNAWLTTMWHVGTGLPWDWRIGPSDSSEREHMLQMVDALPENALVTADAGFAGYQYWKTLLNGGRHFVIRVGANVQLLKKLGFVREHQQTVYLWPNKEAVRNQLPLVLRLVEVHNGKHPVYLVTDLPKSRLSDKQTQGVYKARWGVEIFYRGFKQTFECRKLRSHAAANVPVELNWSLAALWAVCLNGKIHLKTTRANPARLSVAGTLKAIRTPMREYKSSPDVGEDLDTLLSKGIIDNYERTNKTSRDYPTKRKKEPPAGKPKITAANKTQKAKAQEIKKRYNQALNTIG